MLARIGEPSTLMARMRKPGWADALRIWGMAGRASAPNAASAARRVKGNADMA
jgi:hypothetical protein